MNENVTQHVKYSHANIVYLYASASASAVSNARGARCSSLITSVCCGISSDIVNEVFQSLMLNQLKDAVILSSLVIVVVLLKLGTLSFRLLLV